MAKRPPFYHIPGGGPPHPVRDAQIKALTPSSTKAPAARPAIAPILTAAPAADSFTAAAPLRLASGALTLAAASGAQSGYLIQSDWIAFSAKEPALGSPALDGQALVSSMAGVRSWASFPTVPSFADGEIPAGSVNGVNTVFTLAHAPIAGSAHVYIGAAASALSRLASSQYGIAGATLTLTTAPATGSALLIDYRY